MQHVLPGAEDLVLLLRNRMFASTTKAMNEEFEVKEGSSTDLLTWAYMIISSYRLALGKASARQC